MKIIRTTTADPATDVTPRPAAGAEGGESLDALAIEAGALDAAPTAASQAQEARAQEQQADVLESNAGELLAALDLARALLLPLLPPHRAEPLRAIWSDERLQAASEAGAAVLERHGVSMGSVLSDYGPYIALVAALAPPILETRAVLLLPPPQPAQEAGQDGQQ